MYFSLFLYNISVPDKEGCPTVDLSSDEDVKIDKTLTQNFSPKQLSVERIIVKTFVLYRCDVIITDRIRAMFSSKLWRMGKAIRSFGGAKSNSLKEKWRLTKWKVEFDDHECVPYNVKNRKQENVLIMSALKRHSAIESELTEANKNLKDVTNRLRAIEKSQKTVIGSAVSSGHKAVKRKVWSDYSVQHQRKRRRQLQDDIKTALSFTENEGFKPLTVELVNTDTQKTISVPFDSPATETVKKYCRQNALCQGKV